MARLIEQAGNEFVGYMGLDGKEELCCSFPTLVEAKRWQWAEYNEATLRALVNVLLSGNDIGGLQGRARMYLEQNPGG